MTAVEWADEHFYLSPESSYVEGHWTTQPVQIGPLNAMGHDDITEVYWQKSARVGYTKCLLAATLYLVEHKRRNGGIYREDDSAIEKFVQVELDPALRDCKVIHPIFPDLGKKSSNNKANLKNFIGASLRCLGGQSAGNYRGDSLDFVIGDEADGFVWNVQGKSSKEGDPFSVMYKRTNGSAFPKRIVGSTPTRHGQSHIERLSKRAELHLHFFLPCPHCGGEQDLEWTDKAADWGIKWTDSDPTTAHYQCKHCGDHFRHEDYLDMARQGRWVDKDGGDWTRDGIHYFTEDNQPRPVPRRVAFYIWAAYSPTDPWNNLVERWYDAKDDPLTRQGFINTDLGRVYRDDVSKPLNWRLLYEVRESYPAEVPMAGLYLTSFTDVQADRLETTVAAWGLDEEMFVLSHHAFVGDPRQDAVWDELEKLLKRQFKHESGILLEISRSGVDLGGHFTDEAYEFCKRFFNHWVIPCKGASEYNQPIARYQKVASGKHRNQYICLTGTDTAKDTLYTRYQIDRHNPSAPKKGLIHLPLAEWCDKGWCQQATSEIKVFQKTGQKTITRYKKKKDHMPNEALDCLVGNLAVQRVSRQYFGLDLAELATSLQRRQINEAATTTAGIKKRPGGKRKRGGTITGGV